jgi:TonB family protein
MVETEPEDAEVWLNGRLAGLSPIELIGLPVGEHFVRVSKKGYATATESFKIEEGQDPGSLMIELVATHGFLSLSSDPPDAAVVIDGEKAGDAPVENHLLEPGSHEIRVGKRGYQDWTMEIKTEVGEHLDLLARLSAVRSSASARTSTPVTPPKAPATPEPDVLKIEPGPALKTLPPDVFLVGPGVTPPKRISGSPPRYPERARQRKQEGRVTIQMIVTEEGVPTELEVIESAGQLLDEAVLNAVKKWTFEPGKKDGVPVKVRHVIRQSFRIGR